MVAEIITKKVKRGPTLRIKYHYFLEEFGVSVKLFADDVKMYVRVYTYKF